MKTKHLFLGLVVSAAMLTAASATATTIYCGGTISRVLVRGNGNVLFFSSWRNDYTEACSLKGTWNGIDETTCSVWYSILSSAYVHGTNVKVEYTTSTYTCENLPTSESAIAPSYIMAY